MLCQQQAPVPVSQKDLCKPEQAAARCPWLSSVSSVSYVCFLGQAPGLPSAAQRTLPACTPSSFIRGGGDFPSLSPVPHRRAPSPCSHPHMGGFFLPLGHHGTHGSAEKSLSQTSHLLFHHPFHRLSARNNSWHRDASLQVQQDQPPPRAGEKRAEIGLVYGAQGWPLIPSAPSCPLGLGQDQAAPNVGRNPQEKLSGCDTELSHTRLWDPATPAFPSHRCSHHFPATNPKVGAPGRVAPS